MAYTKDSGSGQATVYLVTGEPGRTIAKATKYKREPQSPFIMKSSARASINLWKELESLCLDDEDASTADQGVEKQYADLNTNSLPKEEINESLEFDGKNFNLGAVAQKKAEPLPVPKKPAHRRKMVTVGPVEPTRPNEKLRKVSFPINAQYKEEPADETQRLAYKARLKQSRNSNLSEKVTPKLRNDSTASESDNEPEPTVDSPAEQCTVSSKQNTDVTKTKRKAEHRLKKPPPCFAKKISYVEASAALENTQNKPLDEDWEDDGDNERDYGGGPSGITIGGMKEESFESVFFKRVANVKEKPSEKDDIAVRAKHTIRKTTRRIDPNDFGSVDFMHLKKYPQEVLRKFDPKLPCSKMLFRMRELLVLIQGCRLGVMEVLTHMFFHYSHLFHVDEVFSYTYHDDISRAPYFWFTNTEKIVAYRKTYPLSASLLHIAAANHQIEVVQYLVNEQGASVETEDCCGYTPLMVCTSNLPLVQFFVSKKANVNKQNPYGMAPLMMSAQYGYCKGVVECLLEAGADLHLADKCGRTAIHYFLSAFRKDELELVIATKFFPTSQWGYMSYGGVPLYLYPLHGHQLDALAQTSHPSPSQRVSLKYLEIVTRTKAEYWRFLQFPEVYEETLREAIRYRKKMGVEFKEHPLLEEYGNRREVQNEEELDQLLSNIPEGSTKVIELGFQAILICDRICGFHSFSTLSLQSALIEEMWALKRDKKIQSPENSSSLLKLIDRYSLCLKWYLSVCGPLHSVHRVVERTCFKLHSIIKEFGYPLDDVMMRIHMNITDAVVSYLRSTSYTHFHHETYCKDDASLVKKWLNNLLNKDENYEWFKPIRLHLYRQVDFTYVAGTLILTVFFELLQIRKTSYEDLREYLGVAGRHWLDRPALGTYPLIYCTSVRSPFVSYILNLGAHPDATSHNGYEAYTLMTNRYLRKRIAKVMRPAPLTCQCATYISLNHNDWRSWKMPNHIRDFILMHDFRGHDPVFHKHIGLP